VDLNLGVFEDGEGLDDGGVKATRESSGACGRERPNAVGRRIGAVANVDGENGHDEKRRH